jgi:hypothetical protein
MKLDTARAVALALGVALAIATLSGLVPGLTDASGRSLSKITYEVEHVFDY